jgi:hypothetical protein
MKTVLPGLGSYPGDASRTRTVCTVRTAGPSGNPTATLIERQVGSIAVVADDTDWPLWAAGRVLRRIFVARDAHGDELNDIPMHIAADVEGLPAGIHGWLRLPPRRDRATATATACGHTSPPATLRISGYSPVAAGDYHSIAVRADGTVVGWGWNNSGQTNVPAGLVAAVP